MSRWNVSDQLARDFFAAAEVVRVAIDLARERKSEPEHELERAWRLIEDARGIVRQRANFRELTREEPTIAAPPEPEFLPLPRVGERCPLSGLGRGSLYKLAALGHIRTISLRHRGALRGRRLVEVESLRNYLRKLAIEQSEERPGDGAGGSQ